MKRLLILSLTLILVVSLTLSGCNSGEVSRSEQLQSSLKDIQESLEETFNTDTCKFSLVKDYVKSWAKSNDIDVIKNSSSYIVLENAATEGNKKSDSTTLQCSINSNDAANSLSVLSTAMASLLGPENHGQIRLIITEYTDGQRIGAADVSEKYLDCDNFINMQYSSTQSVYTSGSNTQVFTMSTDAEKISTKYDNAYSITMSMAEYADPYNFEKTSNYPNPVEVLGGLLASAKSSGKLFEVASFTCEKHSGYTPYTATAIVVIDDNNVESFKKKFDTSYENVSKRFDKLEDSFIYTMDEADVPDTVIDDKSADNLISLMYTINTGICYQDEDSGLVYSSAYISDISLKSDSIKVTVNSRARGSDNLETLAKEYEVTSGLCSMDFTSSKAKYVWNSPEDSELTSYFASQVPLDEDSSDITMKTYDNDFFAKTKSGLNIISYTFSSGDQKQVLTNITNFIDPEIEKEPAN